MVFLAAFLDFFDGFFARILKVSGELGKQLDSLADMVSFGVVPGIVMFQWLCLINRLQSDIPAEVMGMGPTQIPWEAYFALIIPVFSCYRLAKFNIDTRQSHGFIGLPTPANAIFFVSIPLILLPFFSEIIDSALDINIPGWRVYHHITNSSFYMSNIWAGGEMLEATGGAPAGYQFLFKANSQILGLVGPILINIYFIISLIIIFSLLLVSEIPLFALKFKNFGWTDNKVRYIFLAISAALLIIFQLLAIPFIIILYILISVINNLVTREKVAGS